MSMLANSCGLAELTMEEFETISTMVKQLCGINLHDGKRELVKARLSKRLRQLQMESFSEYIDYLHTPAGQVEVIEMLDSLSTNLTYFFRDITHFDLLRKLVPQIAARHVGDRQIRIWSAGCSSGEEPYSIAIVLRQTLDPFYKARILGTDLSNRVLHMARKAIYSRDRLREVPPQVLGEHFGQVPGRDHWHYQVNESLRQMVTLGRLNLMDPWPMQGPFDVIFCRNVMIYFDRQTQIRLTERFWDYLSPGGVLFIGHSESLAGGRHRFRYVQPTVYQKE